MSLKQSLSDSIVSNNCVPQFISCIYKKNITSILYKMISDEIRDLQTNLTAIDSLSVQDKLTQNTENIFMTIQDILSDQSYGYLNIINSVSGWLAGPVIGMLNLISGFTCDIKNSITNLNIALGAYSECLLLSEVKVQFNYINNTYNCPDRSFGSYYDIYPHCNTEVATYSIQNLLNVNNSNIPVNMMCSDNVKVDESSTWVEDDDGKNGKYKSLFICSYSEPLFTSHSSTINIPTAKCNSSSVTYIQKRNILC